jgi:hypothetical protein
MRRLVVLIAILAGLVLFGAVLFLKPPQDELAGMVEAGKVEEVRAEEVVYVPVLELYLVADGAEVIALWEDARHVGDRVLFCHQSGHFSSPSHGESFDRLGRYFAGPAQGDMGRFQVVIRDDVVLVDVATGPILGERSTEREQPRGEGCLGQEGAPGFYSDSAG